MHIVQLKRAIASQLSEDLSGLGRKFKVLQPVTLWRIQVSSRQTSRAMFQKLLQYLAIEFVPKVNKSYECTAQLHSGCSRGLTSRRDLTGLSKS